MLFVHPCNLHLKPCNWFNHPLSDVTVPHQEQWVSLLSAKIVHNSFFRVTTQQRSMVKSSLVWLLYTRFSRCSQFGWQPKSFWKLCPRRPQFTDSLSQWHLCLAFSQGMIHITHTRKAYYFQKFPDFVENDIYRIFWVMRQIINAKPGAHTPHAETHISDHLTSYKLWGETHHPSCNTV